MHMKADPPWTAPPHRDLEAHNLHLQRGLSTEKQCNIVVCPCNIYPSIAQWLESQMCVIILNSDSGKWHGCSNIYNYKFFKHFIGTSFLAWLGNGIRWQRLPETLFGLITLKVSLKSQMMIYDLEHLNLLPHHWYFSPGFVKLPDDRTLGVYLLSNAEQCHWAVVDFLQLVFKTKRRAKPCEYGRESNQN